MPDVYCSSCGNIPDNIRIHFDIMIKMKPTQESPYDVVGLLDKIQEQLFSDGTGLAEMFLVRRVYCDDCETPIYEE